MALTPEQISGLRDAFADIAEPINTWLLQDAAERIAAAGVLASEPAGKMTATAAYEIYRAKALGESQRELKKFLKRQLKLSNKEIRRLFRQAARFSRDNDEERVGLTFGADMEQMTAAAVKLAQRDFHNLTQTLGMMAPGGKVLPLRQFYQKSMDFAFEQIFTGAADYETAIRQATTKMADAGVRTIDYESGRSIDIEAAVRRNMMGGMGLLDEQITQVNHDALGCNGWEISAHANSAPDHEPIQGRQYSDREFKALESRLVRRIGTLNCGHVKMPILLGINSPQYTEEQLRAFQEDNAKGITYEGKHYTGYEATQKQRQLECAQRVQKNRILVSRSTGDALREQTAQIRLQMLRQHYKAFSKAADLPLQEDRAWVAGFGRSQGVKAQYVAHRHLADPENFATIKLVSGGRITNQYSKAAREHAQKYYGLVRHMTTDVKRIAANTGFPEKEIARIKSFVFLEKHDLGQGKLQYFDPDFAMAQSWQRLINGTPEPHDITLLKHEIMENRLMHEGLTQEQAHKEASKKYNYPRESDEYYAALEEYHREKKHGRG